jgi:membrane protein DedA with SNARE-associated domain
MPLPHSAAVAFSAPFGISMTEILRDLGYAGLVMLMVVETVFPPIPSEVVLPLAGYLAETGELALGLVLVTSTAGSVMGAVALYEASRRGGRPFATRFLRFARQDPERLAQAEQWFARYGPVVVLVGRCIPGVRSLVSLPAGVLRMPRAEYVAFTAIGSATWNAVLIGAGYALGSQWKRVGDTIGPVSKPLLGVLLLAAGAALLWRGLRTRRSRARLHD